MIVLRKKVQFEDYIALDHGTTKVSITGRWEDSDFGFTLTADEATTLATELLKHVKALQHFEEKP